MWSPNLQYIAIGLDPDGRKDVLGMWVGENESAKFWETVLNGLRNRGVEDIFIACTDNLTGFDTAIHAVFPETEIQNCIHMSKHMDTRFAQDAILVTDCNNSYDWCAEYRGIHHEKVLASIPTARTIWLA